MSTSHSYEAAPTRFGSNSLLKSTALPVAAMCLAAGAITGCGTKSSSPNQAKVTRQSTTPPAKGDVASLRWALPTGEPDSLDPPKAVNLNSGMVVANVCDSLLRVNPDFSLSPNLAKLSGPDDRTLVFDLVADAKFWDGRPVTAQDVQYSLKRAADPQISYTSFLFNQVKSIDVTGAKQVTIRLTAPDPLLGKELGSAPTAIYEKQFAEKAGENFGTQQGGLMCSGPFKLKAWLPGVRIELSRNDAYWNQEWRAHAASASLEFVTDTTALAQSLKTGEIDGAYEISPAIVPSLNASTSGRVLYGPCDCFLTLNPTRPDGPLADIAVRRALFKSIDRAAIAKAIYRDVAEPNYTLLAKSLWDSETKAQWNAAYAPYEKANAFDLSAAKQAVKQSKYLGEPIVLAILAGDAAQKQIATLVQQQGKQIGLNVEIKPLQSITYAQTASDPSARSQLDLIMYASYNNYPDPLETIPFYVTPDVFNYTEYNDKHVQSLITQAKQTLDASKRTDLLIQAQEIYEPSYVMQSLLNTPEISYLKSTLTGATTSFAYLSEPSLARIGANK